MELRFLDLPTVFSEHSTFQTFLILFAKLQDLIDLFIDLFFINLSLMGTVFYGRLDSLSKESSAQQSAHLTLRQAQGRQCGSLRDLQAFLRSLRVYFALKHYPRPPAIR